MMVKKHGATYLGDQSCEFVIWAPFKKSVQLALENQDPIRLEKDDYGYWTTIVQGTSPGTRYKFILDNDRHLPDPASRSQPDGVHSWSEVISQEHDWSDSNWQCMPLSEMIIYELHVGTFTPEGTFEAVLYKLDHLLELGVNAIEIMPIAQFPGSRNWGYDGVYPYAAQHSYGGSEGLKKLVDGCHQKGLAVILDVVYNHMGPEGNYLREYGPYFTDKYATPWGSALNFDDAWCDHVRAFFIQSALMWLNDYHVDGLRLDAVHAIMDHSASHFLRDLRLAVDDLEQKNKQKYYLIAESDMNDVKLINPYDAGGYNLDAQWVDDFHHAVHTLATGEQDGYYADFGKTEFLAKSFQQGFIYDGIYSSFRKRCVGNNPQSQPSHKFVVCIQNHDQVGNRMLGERLSHLVSYEMYKLAAGTMLTSPFVPMLFMGEEYGEDQPFMYFVSHGDPDLVKAVQEGRKKEFEYFQWKGEVPDPQDEQTFLESKLRWDAEKSAKKKALFAYYQKLIELRKQGAFRGFHERNIEATVQEDDKVLMINSKETPHSNSLLAIYNFSKEKRTVVTPKIASTSAFWHKVVASSDTRWGGPGSGLEEPVEMGSKIAVGSESMILFNAKNLKQ